MFSHIHPGSRIAIVAPSGPAEPQAYQAGEVILAARYEIVHGYQISKAPRALPYLADTDENRAEAFNRAIRDPSVEAIFCARGGYGAARILDRLDGEALLRRQIPLVGFSDFTAVHAWVRGLGMSSIHGPVVTQLASVPMADRDALFSLLEGNPMPGLTGLAPLTRGFAQGVLFGGNLTVLCHLLGTPHFPDLAGHILLLEDVGESPYRLDRLLTQLRLSGVFATVAGLILGHFHECDATQGIPPQPVTAREVLLDRLSDLNIPVVMDAPVGHCDRNRALVFGTRVHLDADAGTLHV